MNRKILLLGLSLSLLNSQQAIAPAAGRPSANNEPNKIAHEPIAKSVADKKNCNAFEVWGKLPEIKRPDPPKFLDSVLKEGQRLPIGRDSVQLNVWMQNMAPMVAITKAGCLCSRAEAGDPSERRIQTLELLKLSYVCKVHQIKVKQYLENGQFSNVPPEIGEIIDICRTGFSSKPLAVEFLIYASRLRQGLASIRDCLYWQNCPDAVLSELSNLLNGIDVRRSAGRSVKEECEFIVSQVRKECESGDFLKNADDDFGLNLAHNKANAAVVRDVLKKRSNDFDLNATIALFHEIAAESESNALLGKNNRQELKLNSLRHELHPLLEAVSKEQTPLFAPFTVNALSGRLAKVKNLLGKVIVLDELSREPEAPDFFSAIIENADHLVLEIEGTKFLVELSRYERAKHELPDSLDAISINQHDKKWEGYELQYSKQSRSLQFKQGSLLRRTGDDKRLTWTIPSPEMH